MSVQTRPVRPQGVTILAALFIILALISLLWSTLVLGVGTVTGAFGAVVGAQQPFAAAWQGFLGIATAILQLVVAFGLLGLKKWAWLLALIAIAASALNWLLSMFSGGVFAFCCNGLGLIIPAAILFYLLRPDVRAAFGRA